MKYLTVEQILFIHSRMVNETGGSPGIRDLNLLLSAVDRPKATFDREDLYPDVFVKAAALLQSLINNHPFVDGNKRTGIASTALFLNLNGWTIVSSNEDLFMFTIGMARGNLSLKEAEDWLIAHSTEI